MARPISLLIAVSLLAAVSIPARAETPSGVLPPEVAARKSEFNDKADFGQDPFFPNSTRRAPAKPVTTAGPAKPQPKVELILQGIISGTAQPLAMINGKNFAVGDELTVRAASGSIKVKCLEIRENSVVVQFQGERKELQMRK